MPARLDVFLCEEDGLVEEEVAGGRGADVGGGGQERLEDVLGEVGRGWVS